MAEDRETLVARTMLRDSLPPMSRQEWWRGAAIYQIYTRSFQDSTGDGIGDLKGVAQRLDYIEALGVDGFWLTPFFPSPQKDFGYDITDFRNVDPIHGTLDDFIDLLEKTHARGLKLLIDFVPCHTSDEHPWFAESRADRAGPLADWYVWADAAPDGGPPNNWLSSFGGSAWTWDPRRSQYYYHPFLTCQPALDLLNPAALEAMIAQMRFWLDLGVDGFRLDAVQCLACDPDLRANPRVGARGQAARFGGGPNNPFARQVHLFDRDVPEALDVVARLREATAGYAPERALIGELADMDSSRLSEKYTVEGRAFHAVYDFDLINKPPHVEALVDLLATRSAFLRTGWLMNVFSNHDSARGVSNLTDWAVEVGRRDEAARMLLFLQFALKGGGIVFQGDELGLPHPKLTRDQLRDPWGINLWPDFEGRDGARTPMPWSARKRHGGFTTGAPWLDLADEHRPLAVDVQEADAASCLHFARELLAWRRKQPLLRWGGERVRPAALAPLILWDRFDEDATITCVANFSLDDRILPWREVEGGAILAAPGAATTRSAHGLPVPGLGFAAIKSKGRPDAEHGLANRD